MAIINANQYAQGYDVNHVLCPYDTLIRSQGYVYSHSVPVTYSEEETIIHHCYRHAQMPDQVISVWLRMGSGLWRFDAHQIEAVGGWSRPAYDMRRFLKGYLERAKRKAGVE